MFDITKLALKIPNFLTHEECDGLIQEFNQRLNETFKENSKNYKTNQNENSTFSALTLKPYTKNFNFIKEKTKQVVNAYLDYLDYPKYFFTDSLKNVLQYSHQYRIMEYKTGANIHPHSDHDPGTYGSISFNLNEDYEGGEFKFFNGNYTVSLNKGDALIFPADYFWVHEVTKVTKGTRYSINSFLNKYPFEAQNKVNYLEHLIGKDHVSNTPPEELLGPYN